MKPRTVETSKKRRRFKIRPPIARLVLNHREDWFRVGAWLIRTFDKTPLTRCLLTRVFPCCVSSLLCDNFELSVFFSPSLFDSGSHQHSADCTYALSRAHEKISVTRTGFSFALSPNSAQFNLVQNSISPSTLFSVVSVVLAYSTCDVCSLLGDIQGIKYTQTYFSAYDHQMQINSWNASEWN